MALRVPDPSKNSTAAAELAAGKGIGDLLAIGFGCTAAMWTVGYLGHMPLTQTPGVVLLPAMLLTLIAAGWVVGRYTKRGVRGATWVGLITTTLNLLILGSLLKPSDGGQFVPHAWLWLPGTFLLGTALPASGWGLARIAGTPRATSLNWTAGFAWVAALTALLLIGAGGLVTGFRAGLAVPDWPNTFGANMFLYPLARMSGGVFYEHAHRLLGALVGLTTLVLAVYLSLTRQANVGHRALVWIVFAAVAVQGALGGFRVTRDSHSLAVVHGFFAHAILAGLAALAVTLSRRWQARAGAERRDAADTDHVLTALLVAMLLIQTLLGAMVRQVNEQLLAHVTFAAIVALAGLGVGMRAWGLNSRLALLRRLGMALMGVIGLQVTLGLIALAFRTPSVDRSPTAAMLAAQQGQVTIPALNALLTTAHQVTAAVLLSVAVTLMLWSWRLLRQIPQATAERAVGHDPA